MTDNCTATSDDSGTKSKDFICGVVEGFYGRPWTTEQRKDLFQKLKKWGMDSYVYAPKDDYKHRAYWRELYTVEEAEHLTSLIAAAKAQNIVFYYALSPGLDITYSSQKEITALKRKLEQVSQFGCTAFALLFDDIEPEMSEADKQIFQSFAHAQVSVTNEIHQHLGSPGFLLCPTQYCSTRAVPTVNNSEYLNTLGSKLSKEIDVMWTGPKVISKVLTSACIEEITQVLRRPPVIWDNLHANDYDQKRVFLGPYCGRSPELIPLLRGVLTNPNCEYNANMVPIRTLAHWANCSLDAPSGLDAVSSDIKLERESEEGMCEDDLPVCVNKHVYHHRQALKNALNEWLPEFSIPKDSFGPIVKPQPIINVAPVPIIPILPSVNTCMTLTTPTPATTTTSSAGGTLTTVPAIPTLSSSQLQALADVCTNVSDVAQITPVENFNPISNPMMNSLVSATKVVMNESIPNPILPLASSNISLPTEIPVSTISVPLIGLKNLDPESQERQAQAEEPIAPRDPLESETDQAMTDETSVVQNGAAVNGVANEALSETNGKQGDGKRAPEENNTEDSETIVVDDVDPLKVELVAQPNGHMSVGESPLTMSPSQTDTMEVLEPSTEFTPGAPATTLDADIVMTDGCSENGSMQVEPACSPVGSDMMVEANDVSNESSTTPNALTVEDLSLLCDLLYLPFEHGARAMRLMHDFNWLKSNATVLLPPVDAKDKKARSAVRPETSEWRRRCARFLCYCGQVWRLARRLALCRNKELAHDLFAYVWDLCGIVSLLSGYAQWLALAKFPPNVVSHTHGTYTWFSAGWKEAFTSGDQEPWVFRGGLGADLRRLVPVECAGCELLARPAIAAVPVSDARLYAVRPYAHHDQVQVCNICHKTCRDGMDCTELFPSDLQTLPADRLVTPFLTLTPEFCMVIQDETDALDAGGLAAPSKSGSAEKLDNGLESEERSKRDIVGYACAALDSRTFYRKQELAWVPEMVKKYPLDLLEGRDLSQAAKECIQHFHSFSYSLPENVARAHPSILCCSVLPRCQDPAAPARLLTCLLAALRANGSFGVHVCINSTDHYMHQFYSKLGFTELTHDAGRVYLGRTF